MTSGEIRERYLSYFERHGHRRVASAPVIPWGDPTLMFTNAGMNQFKDLFLGREKREYARATTCQKCIRAGGKHNDLEEVGRTTRHGTFLEMLGNFSFGDYFKKDAIAYAWGFLTTEIGLDPGDLYVSVYSTDDEAFAIWRDDIGLSERKILRFGNIEKGDEENFWSMGPVGPCGPCSEIYIDRGSAYGPDDPYEALAQDAPRFLELWNLVFMQFSRDESGRMEPLPKPSIDTGLGLERMAMIMQNKENIFETDILGSIVKRVEEFSGKKYEDAAGMPFRVAADHVRTLTFAIADGAVPSNEGRGYVLRRILRRASRYIRQLDVHEPLLYRLVGDVVDHMSDAYPEIGERADYIAMVIKGEEERFLRTLDQGVDLFEGLVGEHRARHETVISGEDAFKLYDTYGFPVDLTRIMAEEIGMTVDMDAFERAMELQRQRAREASAFVSADDSGGPWTELGSGEGVKSSFVGYDTDSVSAALLRFRTGEEGTLELVFDRTPFYAHSGGQVCDTGAIRSGDGTSVLAVKDVRDHTEAGRVHICEILEGGFAPGLFAVDAVLTIDADRRRATERNHSSTHLLQAALRNVLGDHVRQSGSYVDAERLRFDFNHFAGMKVEELEMVERLVNRYVIEDYPVEVSEKTLKEARALGAMSLFEEKYGDTVRMVKMGDVSLELCGGTHVSRTGRIGLFRIVSESSVAAGIRRIEAVTGMTAYDMARNDRSLVQMVSRELAITPDGIFDRIGALSVRIRELEKENRRIRTHGTAGGDDLLSGAVDLDGIKVVFGRIDVSDTGELKGVADMIRGKIISGVAVVGATVNGKVTIIATVTDDIIKSKSLKAGDIVRELAVLVGGSGGGRPHFAMAGGKDADKLDAALASVPSIIMKLAGIKD